MDDGREHHPEHGRNNYQELGTSMNPFADRAAPISATEEPELLELSDPVTDAEPAFGHDFDREQWAENRAEEHGAGGRKVLGFTLVALAAAWLAFSA